MESVTCKWDDFLDFLKRAFDLPPCLVLEEEKILQIRDNVYFALFYAQI